MKSHDREQAASIEGLRVEVELLHKDFFESQKVAIIQRTIQLMLLALILWRVW